MRIAKRFVPPAILGLAMLAPVAAGATPTVSATVATPVDWVNTYIGTQGEGSE